MLLIYLIAIALTIAALLSRKLKFVIAIALMRMIYMSRKNACSGSICAKTSI